MKKLILSSLTLILSSQVYANFNVYPGCSKPPKKYKRTVTLDAGKGQTLQSYFSSNSVKPGDHLIVKGHQGAFSVSKYTSAYIDKTFQKSPEWVWIDSQGATFDSISVGHLSKLLFTKVSVSKFPTPQYANLVAFSDAKDIIFQESEVFGVRDSSKWTVKEWIEVASAIASDNSKCVAISNNKIFNVRFGISVFTRAKKSSKTSIKARVSENELRNISGDFMRPNGSDIIMEKNRGYDSYVSIADGDGNHDDFIQGFAFPLGIVYSNVQILGNYYQESTNPTRKYNARSQGISVFDGIYNNIAVIGNTVLADGYHGITLMGARNSVIENNTVLGTGDYYLWISVPGTKGSKKPDDVVVRNNIANVLMMDKKLDVKWKNNFSISVADSPANFVLFDKKKGLYDVRPKPGSSVYKKGAGSLTK